MAKHRACLIGNWAYDVIDGSMPALTGPRHDVVRLRESLEHLEYGLFRDGVEVHENLSDAQIRTVLHQVADSSEPEDILLIYYSGHGERLGMEQRLGLVGVDVPQHEARARALDSQVLREWLDEARARSKLLILDCCYSGQVKGQLAIEDVLSEFSEGTYVLSSGGNQVVDDAASPESPSPFTAALTEVLVDQSLAGRNGFLSADDVFDALTRRTPRLRTPPKRNVNARGHFSLARRPLPTNEPADLEGWNDVDVTRVSVNFQETRVVAAWDRDRDGRIAEDERDATALDPNRLAAVRRLCQLADAVMRARDYRQPEWQARARRALDTGAANLFHTAMPPGVRALLEQTSKDPTKLVRLDLAFNPPWAPLTDYPWEYLHLPSTEAEDQGHAIRTGLVVTRVGAPQFEASRSHATGVIPDIAVINSLGPPYDQMAMRLAEEVDAMPHLRAVNTPKREPARWADFMRAVDQKPHILVLFAPLTREDHRPRIGFDRADHAHPEPDWRNTTSLITQLEPVSGLSLIVLVTVAGDAGTDAFRAAPAAARELSDRLGVPVVFVCHTPGLESYIASLQGTEPQTLLGLLLAASASGKDLATSLWYARERVLRYIDDELVPTLGMPGLVEPARPVTAQRTHRSIEPRLRAPRAPSTTKGPS